MTNVNLLKSKMVAAGDTDYINKLATLLDVSRTTASKKLNGEKSFTQQEIAVIAAKYNLSAEDIKEIFKVAYNYYELPAVYCGKTESEIVEINGASRKASAEFTTYDEMLNSLKKYMSIEVIAGKSPWSATAKEYYLEKDGKLYCNETNKGYIYNWGNVEIEITNQSADKVESVATMELIDPDNNKTYDKVNITLELKDNNWIITSYKK